MHTALVTGACGFVGRSLVQALTGQYNYRVFAVDCVSGEHFADNSSVEYICSDLTNINGLADKIWECDVVFHLAWAGVRPELRSNITVQKKNIDISINVIRLAQQAHIRRAVFLGSTMEYCYNESPICDTSFPTPSNCYGSCKIAVRFICEQMCRENGIEFEYAVVTSIYGPGREDSNVIFYCIKQLLEGRSPNVSKCTQRWDFVHISDAVNALVLIAQKGTPFSCYAVGTGENRILKDYISIISNEIDSSKSVNYGARKNNDSRIQNSAVDITRLTNDTGYKPAYSFSSGIREIINYYRSKK